MDIEFLEKGTEFRELFIGRFQPFHSGHARAIEKMDNPIIAIVKGKKTSADKKTNPFSFSTQKMLITRLFPKLKVIEVSSGYIPEIANDLRKSGIEIVKVYAGEDRIDSYRSQLSINKELDQELRFNFDVVLAERSGSATGVRIALASDDVESYRKLMPETLWCEYSALKAIVKLNGIVDRIHEESNVTAGVEGLEAPIKPKRKKKHEIQTR